MQGTVLEAHLPGGSTAAQEGGAISRRLRLAGQFVALCVQLVRQPLAAVVPHRYRVGPAHSAVTAGQNSNAVGLHIQGSQASFSRVEDLPG